MAESNRAAYDELLKRTDVPNNKQDSASKRPVREVETRDSDKTGYYELLRKTQRSRDNTSLKAR
jgi:hypothetical protein